jgi:uncharacterized protein with GYD domain
MLLIVQGKFRKKPTKEMLAQVSKIFEQMAKEGTKFVAQYWTLGRYDITSIVDGKDEKTLVKAMIRFGDILSLETLVAVPREEAIKLVE